MTDVKISELPLAIGTVSEIDNIPLVHNTEGYWVTHKGVVGELSDFIHKKEPSWSLVGSSTAVGTNPSITNPDTIAGDFMIMAISSRNTTPSGLTGGWTELYRKDLASAEWVMVYWRIAGESEPSNYNMVSGAGVAVVLVAFRGVSSIVSDSPSFYNNINTTASTKSKPGGVAVFIGHSCYQDSGYSGFTEIPVERQVKATNNDTSTYVSYKDTPGKFSGATYCHMSRSLGVSSTHVITLA